MIDWRECDKPTQQWLKDSDPSDPDTDDDGLTDAEEKEGWEVTVEDKTPYHVRSSPRDEDVDEDDLTDAEEKVAGTDPCNRDTDCDGSYDTNDEFELANGLDPLNFDTNDDGVSDGEQIDFWLEAGFTLEEAIAKTIDHWPIADANGPYAGEEGSAINFEASGSDPDGDPLTYRWDFNNDNEWDTEWSSDPTAEYTYGDDFFETAKVEVSDGLLSVTASASVTVNNVAPSARIDAIEQPNPHIILPVVHTLTFTGSFTDPGWLDIHTSIWDIGDGTSVAGTLSEENIEPDATGTSTTDHTYSESGTYSVTLTVEDDDAGIGTDTVTVTILSAEEALPVVDHYIQDLPDAYFKFNPDQLKNTLSEKIDETLELIDAGEYQDAIDKLKHDIRAKADGSVDGFPNNDWIIDPKSQREICTMIDDLIAYLETNVTTRMSTKQPKN